MRNVLTIRPVYEHRLKLPNLSAKQAELHVQYLAFLPGAGVQSDDGRRHRALGASAR